MDRAKKRKSSAHPSLSSITTCSADGYQSQSQNDWDSTSPIVPSGGTSTQQQKGSSFSNISGQRRHNLDSFDRPENDSMALWDEPSSHQQQHRKPSTSMFLDTITDELASPAFDPLIANFDDIDFSDIDDGHFEAIATPLDLTFARLSNSESPQASIPQHQHQQTQQLLDNTSSSTSSPSYQDSTRSQSTGTPSSTNGDVNFWTTQLEELSQKPHKSPIPLDETLHHSSQLLPRVSEALRALSSTDSVSSTATQLILILVCLTQAISLFEQCIPSIIGGDSGANGSSSTLSLHLGAYQVDREVQQALQMHVVGRELSSILQVSKVIKQMLLQSDWSGVSRRTHGLLLEDLQVRTKTLVYQMKQKGISGRRLGL